MYSSVEEWLVHAVGAPAAWVVAFVGGVLAIIGSGLPWYSNFSGLRAPAGIPFLMGAVVALVACTTNRPLFSGAFGLVAVVAAGITPFTFTCYIECWGPLAGWFVSLVGAVLATAGGFAAWALAPERLFPHLHSLG